MRRQDSLWRDFQGWQLLLRQLKWRALSLTAYIGLYDWHSALDHFAAKYEAELAPMFRYRMRGSDESHDVLI